MQKKTLFDSIEIKSPCNENWDEMFGNDQVRFCSHCAKNVHNLSAMTRKEAKKLVAKSNGNLCVRYIKRPDGKILTLGQRLHQIKRQTGIAAGVLGTSLTVSLLTYAQGDVGFIPRKASQNQEKNVTKTKPQTIEKISNKNNQPKEKPKVINKLSEISFTVWDEMLAVVPNAEVKLINETSKAVFVVLTNDEGIAYFKNLPKSSYEISIKSTGFREFKRSVEIKQEVEPNIKVILSVGAIMGEIAIAWYDVPFLLAIEQGDVAEVKRLIESGIDVNIKDRKMDNMTALHVAVESGNIELVALLISNGANVNARTKTKQTPLFMIDEDTPPEMVFLLIQSGADVNAQDSDGETALMKAADDDNLPLVKALLELGANPNLKNNDDETALDLTTDDEIEQLLISYGAVK